MSESLQLEYFYGVQAEEYKFYQIPKILITDSRFNTLNNDAKLAYGLLLDRMSLSIKNNWFDKQNSCHSEAEHEHTKRRDIPGNTAFVPAVA